MMKIILATLFIMINLYAQEAPPEHCVQKIDEILDLKDVSLQGVAAAFKECPTDEDIIFEKVKADYDKYYGKKKINTGTVKGFRLQAPAGMLTIASKMLGNKPPSAWKSAAKDCKTLMCAFTKLLGSEKAAMQVFNFKAKTGYILSFDQSINGKHGEQIWSPKEIQELEAAADKLPPSLQNLPLKTIERYKDGLRLSIHSESVAAYASPWPKEDPRLHFYDLGAKGAPKGPNSYTSTSWPQEVLIHELCHHYDSKHYWENYEYISERKGSTFGSLSSWKLKSNKQGKEDWQHHDHAHFVSGYAQTSPAEDYAETCMSYVLYPEKLKKKAPDKYAYMKKYLFKNQEFTDSPWTKSGKKQWPRLNDLLADESSCSHKINSCLHDISFEHGYFMESKSTKNDDGSTITSFSTYFRTDDIFKTHPCMKRMKEDYISLINTELKVNDENYCEFGGDASVREKTDQICLKTINDMTAKLDAVKDLKIDKYAKACEDDKDFTHACIRDKVTKHLNLPATESSSLMNRVINKKIPDRMREIGKHIDKLKTADWIKSCFKEINQVSVYSIENENKKMFYYYSSNENIKQGTIATYKSFNDKAEDVQKSCAKNILKTFESAGFKTPESGNVNLILEDKFKAEFNSFEKDVLANIEEVTKKCLISKRCKKTKVKELVDKWFEKDLSKRTGTVDDEFIEKLIEMGKFRLN